ncbi:uncharacterized protein PRCAT00004509001 [Priceomyces carsonii]|uniref:uncharacterized protein n=1 Tax=Priceomyces carsonii TaxID=28549 RepID=UPI002EDAE38C|nr:unnamed protein product [Priceomyces carsonii]
MAKKDIAQKENIKKDLKKASKSLSPSKKISGSLKDFVLALQSSYKDHVKELTPKLILVDVYLSFLVLLGVLQFVYVILVGNFPFNAFLGGFISCVGQFVLTVSLRLQINVKQDATSPATKSSEDNTATDEVPFKIVTPERAFGDYIFASLILHFLVFHFIN